MNQDEAKILYSNLLHIPRALCNERALFVLLVTGLSMAVLAFLGYSLAGSVSPAIATLLIFPVLLLALHAGASIAGVLLMDQARGQTPRPLLKAVSDGIPACLRTLGIMLLAIVLMVLFYLFIYLLLFACKLPATGPVLYAVLFPVMVIAAGLLYFGLMAGLSMASPAIWNGATVSEALQILWRIVTNRTVELLVNLLLLTALIVLAELILFSVFFVGGQIIQGASASVLGTKSLFAFSQDPIGFFAALSQSDYVYATIFGSVIGLMLFLAAIAAMALMGINLIYLQITKNLPQAKALERARIATPQGNTDKDKKEPTFQPVPQATASMSNNPDSGAPDILASFLAETAPAATATGSTPRICPHCRALLQSGDRFCGECGGHIQG
ncbi:MAG: zinc ribbon domain-containing protein [Azoarcus sp.]|jgi:hypothetical protein|nr:zinc ribbon domain-containing protein [Azoarcus sp.]